MLAAFAMKHFFLIEILPSGKWLQTVFQLNFCYWIISRYVRRISRSTEMHTGMNVHILGHPSHEREHVIVENRQNYLFMTGQIPKIIGRWVPFDGDVRTRIVEFSIVRNKFATRTEAKRRVMGHLRIPVSDAVLPVPRTNGTLSSIGCDMFQDEWIFLFQWIIAIHGMIGDGIMSWGSSQ